MADAIYYAVYIYAPRRNLYLRATGSWLTREATERTEAVSRNGAVIVSGTLGELPATLAPEEVSRRTGRAVPDAAPTTAD